MPRRAGARTLCQRAASCDFEGNPGAPVQRLGEARGIALEGVSVYSLRCVAETVAVLGLLHCHSRLRHVSVME